MMIDEKVRAAIEEKVHTMPFPGGRGLPGASFQRQVLDLPSLEVGCRFWQRLIRLQDWDIQVKLLRRHEMTGATNFGECQYSTTYRRATIKLLDPIDFTPEDHARDQDLEDTLLHELLHLHFLDLNLKTSKADEERSPEEKALERAIEAIVGGLLRIFRLDTAE